MKMSHICLQWHSNRKWQGHMDSEVRLHTGMGLDLSQRWAFGDIRWHCVYSLCSISGWAIWAEMCTAFTASCWTKLWKLAFLKRTITGKSELHACLELNASVDTKCIQCICLYSPYLLNAYRQLVAMSRLIRLDGHSWWNHERVVRVLYECDATPCRAICSFQQSASLILIQILQLRFENLIIFMKYDHASANPSSRIRYVITDTQVLPSQQATALYSVENIQRGHSRQSRPRSGHSGYKWNIPEQRSHKLDILRRQSWPND